MRHQPTPDVAAKKRRRVARTKRGLPQGKESGMPCEGNLLGFHYWPRAIGRVRRKKWRDKYGPAMYRKKACNFLKRADEGRWKTAVAKKSATQRKKELESGMVIFSDKQKDWQESLGGAILDRAKAPERIFDMPVVTALARSVARQEYFSKELKRLFDWQEKGLTDKESIFTRRQVVKLFDAQQREERHMVALLGGLSVTPKERKKEDTGEKKEKNDIFGQMVSHELVEGEAE